MQLWVHVPSLRVALKHERHSKLLSLHCFVRIRSSDRGFPEDDVAKVWTLIIFFYLFVELIDFPKQINDTQLGECSYIFNSTFCPSIVPKIVYLKIPWLKNQLTSLKTTTKHHASLRLVKRLEIHVPSFILPKRNMKKTWTWKSNLELAALRLVEKASIIYLNYWPDLILPRATFKDLKTRGLISQSDYRTLNFSMLYDTSEWNNVDLMVMARLNEKIVLNGHQAISLTLARPDLLPPTWWVLTMIFNTCFSTTYCTVYTA